MSKISFLLILMTCMSTAAQTSGESTGVLNLLTAPPYNDTEMGKRVLVDQPYLFMMQVALNPGQAVPQHNANSNVNILVLDGDVVITLAGKNTPAKNGDLVPVTFGTPMSIKNSSQKKATFVIIKAPHPNAMEK